MNADNRPESPFNPTEHKGPNENIIHGFKQFKDQGNTTGVPPDEKTPAALSDLRKKLEAAASGQVLSEDNPPIPNLDPIQEIIYADPDQEVEQPTVKRLIAGAVRFLQRQAGHPGRPNPDDPKPKDPDLDPINPINSNYDKVDKLIKLITSLLGGFGSPATSDKKPEDPKTHPTETSN